MNCRSSRKPFAARSRPSWPRSRRLEPVRGDGVIRAPVSPVGAPDHIRISVLDCGASARLVVATPCSGEISPPDQRTDDTRENTRADPVDAAAPPQAPRAPLRGGAFPAATGAPPLDL